MNKKDLDGKKVMHIDTSGKLHEGKITGIAYKTVGTNLHKGLALSIKLKKELKRDLDIDKDFPRIYAICIYYLIRESLDIFDVLVICGDENYVYVKRYLDLLFEENKIYFKKEIISIYELREITGDKNIRSYADGIASAYRKRGLKSRGRQQKNVPLNVVEVNYKKLREKWLEIDKKCK